MTVTPGADVSTPRTTTATVQGALTEWAERDSRAPAILAPGRPALTIGALTDELESMRSVLAARDLGRGDRVAVLARHGPWAAVAILGVSCSATCVPLDPALPEAECAEALIAAGVRALLVPAGSDLPALQAARRLGTPVIEHPERTVPPAHDLRRADRRHGRGGATADDVALLLRTSGSTARAKLVPSTHRELLARAAKSGRLLGIGEDDRCLNPMPLCYANGSYSGLILPLVAGGSVICPPDADADAFLESLKALRPTWYTAGATHQRAILGWIRRRPDMIDGHSLRFVRSGAAALPPVVMRELEELLGIPVVEAYGASETGVIAANPPYGRRKAGTVGFSLTDDVAVVDERGRGLAPGDAGEVVVRGPTVFAGYESDDGLTRESFHGEWFRTGDLGSLDPDGYLTLLGRASDVINRGGEKVSPAEVESVLLEHPAVVEAVAFAIPHRTLGQDVGAAVVLAGHDPTGEAELRGWVRERLVRHKVPRRVAIATEFPRSPSGKLSRLRAAERFSVPEPTPASSDGGAPPTPMEAAILPLWSEALELEEIGLDDDFFDLGGDSLAAVELFAGIDQELQLQLPPEALLEMPTVRQLAAILERTPSLQGPALSASRDLVGVNTEGSRSPLFGVCGRFGYAVRLLLVGRKLGADQPCYGLQPPGMDWEAAGCRTIPEIASHYLAQVRALQPEGPYRLLGTSFGGLVVYEMALQLRAAGQEVDLLVLVDTSPTRCSWAEEAGGHRSVGPVEGEVLTSRPSAGLHKVHSRAMRVADTHVQAREAYVMDEPFDGELTYFYCQGTLVPALGDRRRLWESATTGSFSLLPLPGRHGRFDREPQFSALVAGLRARLSGRPPPSDDSARIFERSYRLDSDGRDEVIEDEGGARFRVRPGSIRGQARVRADRWGDTRVRGWAADGDGRPPAAIAVFLDGSYVGYGGCGEPGPTEEKRREERPYSGFLLRLAMPCPTPKSRLRVFALADDGRASELGRGRVSARRAVRESRL